ncbi:MAG: hypothetical protein ALECFALPRED_007931 [Alectoria fallacina]|uniref:Uncharacterized protein n=1 Tax=Alectoria fallacina TaxID=1903189 RepID=A0A8H3J1I7_9LECA|nr:MAG: hypothetical protein ALECFALPRED_007931 [Alectoria fallacina]
MDGISPTRGVIEGNNADITQSTGDSATIDNIHTKGIDPMDDLVASMKTARSQDMYADMKTSPERYIENLYLLGIAWVRKVQHVARQTLNSPKGPIWPAKVEPMALALFAFLRQQPSHGACIPDRADYADELDFAWPVPGAGIGTTKQENKVIQRRFGSQKTANRAAGSTKTKHMRQNTTTSWRSRGVPTMAQYIKTNKFYQVGDDETACEQPQCSPRCRDRCHHSHDAHTLKELKRRHGLVRAPGIEPENEYGGIE